MPKLISVTALTILSLAAAASLASAQTFEKKNYNYSEWTKGRFSEAVTLIGMTASSTIASPVETPTHHPS